MPGVQGLEGWRGVNEWKCFGCHHSFSEKAPAYMTEIEPHGKVRLCAFCWKRKAQGGLQLALA